MNEVKFVMTKAVLQELLMESWVAGWRRKNDTNDNGKIDDSIKIIVNFVEYR
jgi:hypothetical protein